MPTELVKRINLDLLYPPFLARLLETLSDAQTAGHVYYVTLGTRTLAEQAKIYFQGRTTPGKIVTNARPGFSCHNYGIAVDVVFDADKTKPGLQPDWAPAKYDALAHYGKDNDLQVGVPGIADYGHVQLPITAKYKGKERDFLGKLKALTETKGLKASWALLDSLGFG